jgi:hypothetical protein
MPLRTPTPLNSIDLQLGQWLDIYTAVFAALPMEGARLVREDGAKACAFGPLAWPSAGRLASRAALISSGDLRSGSEAPCFSRARATWRLCRFASRLSMCSTSIKLAALSSQLREGWWDLVAASAPASFAWRHPAPPPRGRRADASLPR